MVRAGSFMNIITASAVIGGKPKRLKFSEIGSSLEFTKKGALKKKKEYRYALTKNGNIIFCCAGSKDEAERVKDINYSKEKGVRIKRIPKEEWFG